MMKQVAAFLLAGSLFAQSQHRLTDQRIVELVGMGVSETEILRVIQTASHFDFDLRPPSTDAMLQAGVSEDVIRAMAAREAGGSATVQGQPQAGSFSRPLPLPARAPAGNVSAPSAFGTAIASAVPGATAFDQPPKPIYSPLPEELGEAAPVAVSIEAIPAKSTDAYTLSDAQVQQLIDSGGSSNNALGVLLTASPVGPTGASVCPSCTPSSSTATVYTREEWIELAARNAKRQNQSFSIADVPFAARMPLLYVTEPASAWKASSAQRISLRDSSGHGAIQSLELPNGAIGTSPVFKLASAGTIAAAFQISDVNALRASDPKGEFFISIAGAGNSSFFKVTADSLRALFGDHLQSAARLGTAAATAAP